MTTDIAMLPSRPLAGIRGAAAALGLALLMCWPIWVTGDDFVYFDTAGYLDVGNRILAPLWERGASGGGAGVADVATGEDKAGSLRSFAYAIYAAAAHALGGGLVVALIQGWATIWTVLVLVPRAALARPGAALALALLAALTTLPWYVSYLMPDILAALVIAYGAVLWRAFDEIGPAARIVLGLLAAGAMLSHYGNPPLGMALFGAVLLARLVQRRLTLAVVAAAVLPVLASPLANLGASSVVLDTPSVAPKRLPILLARSIEDGPAAWYLADACPEADLAFCAAFGEDIPRNISTLLWSERGIRSLTEAQLQAIREEETQVLAAAFLAYPLAQTASLTRNAALQVARVGLTEIRPRAGPGLDTGAPSALSTALKRGFDRLVDWTSLIGALALLPLCALRRDRIPAVLIVVLGLLLNAAVFGGLSAPVDRYQGRVVWLLPALALILAAETLGLRLRGRN